MYCSTVRHGVVNATRLSHYRYLCDVMPLKDVFKSHDMSKASYAYATNSMLLWIDSYDTRSDVSTVEEHVRAARTHT